MADDDDATTAAAPNAVRREPAPAWFVALVRRNLAALVALNMEHHPAADTIEVTARAWVASLWPERAWCQARDTARIGEAFRRIAAGCIRWPTPAVFLAHLPAAPEPRALPEPRPAPNPAAARRLAELRRRLLLRQAGLP